MWPLSMVQAWMRTASAGVAMAIDVQSVINLRILGLAGLRASPEGEGWRMIHEKQPAFMAAGIAWQNAILAGDDWSAQAEAATRPLARKARSNHRRLMRR
ncbi:antifreeze protein [Primorskyibacter sp. 2E233]|uniref:antifreeze protein n=1 Tax=Primorskyibacter sp. 2E233 TaxID=3413431 RepID=UPI003BF2A34A